MQSVRKSNQVGPRAARVDVDRGTTATQWVFLIMLAGLCAYWPALTGEFIWDDEHLIAQNPLVHQIDGLYRMWFTREPIDYWPMTTTAFWIEWRLWGAATTGYHVANVLLHILNALLLWAVLRQLRIPGAPLAGLFFVLHPLNVESVAWIAQRKNTLSMAFCLLALFWYFKSDAASNATGGLARNRSPRQDGVRDRQRAVLTSNAGAASASRPNRWYWFSLAAFGAAMLSKASVATFPLMLLLMAWWRRGRLGGSDALRVLPFLSVALALALVTIWFQMERTLPPREVTLIERLLGAAGTIWFYLGKAVLPLNLLFVYPQWNIDSTEFRWWLPLGAALATTLILVWLRNRPPVRALLFAWIFFCLALVPVMGLVDVYFMRFSLVADHYAYMALLAVAAGFGAIATRGAESVRRAMPEGTRRSIREWAVLGTCAALLLLLGIGSWRQAHLYVNGKTLWTATSRGNQRCWLCEINLSVSLIARGTEADLQQAEAHLDRAVQINPSVAEAYQAYGVIWQLRGRFKDAIAAHEQAVTLDASLTSARDGLNLARQSLAVVSIEAGRFEEAVTILAQALRDAPYDAGIRQKLGYALLHAGRAGEGLTHLHEAVRLDPRSPEIHDTLGTAWRMVGRSDVALAEFREAVRLDPANPTWRNNLGSALMEAGRFQEGAREFVLGLERSPDSAALHRNLGVALAGMGELMKAAEHLRLAVQLEPNFLEAQEDLTELMQQLNDRQ